MPGSWLNRCTLLTAAAALAVVATGACVTSAQGAGSWLGVHLTSTIILAALWIGVAVLARKDRPALRLAFAALGLLAIEGGLGERANAPWIAVAHATVAPVVLTLAACGALCTSAGWKAGPVHVFDHGSPSLRSLAVLTPVLVMVQIVLGACFRHKTMGLTWHIIGAMVVALVILIFGMFVNQQFPAHRALRPYANAMLAVAMTQVLLGVAAITTLMLAPENTVTSGIVASTVAHVTVGALTLATAMTLALQIHRNVQKAAEEPEEEGPTVAL